MDEAKAGGECTVAPGETVCSTEESSREGVSVSSSAIKPAEVGVARSNASATRQRSFDDGCVSGEETGAWREDVIEHEAYAADYGASGQVGTTTLASSTRHDHSCEGYGHEDAFSGSFTGADGTITTPEGSARYVAGAYREEFSSTADFGPERPTGYVRRCEDGLELWLDAQQPPPVDDIHSETRKTRTC